LRVVENPADGTNLAQAENDKGLHDASPGSPFPCRSDSGESPDGVSGGVSPLLPRLGRSRRFAAQPPGSVSGPPCGRRRIDPVDPGAARHRASRSRSCPLAPQVILYGRNEHRDAATKDLGSKPHAPVVRKYPMTPPRGASEYS
jgi:hypothetical protein